MKNAAAASSASRNMPENSFFLIDIYGGRAMLPRSILQTLCPALVGAVDRGVDREFPQRCHKGHRRRRSTEHYGPIRADKGKRRVLIQIRRLRRLDRSGRN